jgi:hypothetical protein
VWGGERGECIGLEDLFCYMTLSATKSKEHLHVGRYKQTKNCILPEPCAALHSITMSSNKGM